jgi:hypothetical protein
MEKNTNHEFVLSRESEAVVMEHVVVLSDLFGKELHANGILSCSWKSLNIFTIVCNSKILGLHVKYFKIMDFKIGDVVQIGTSGNKGKIVNIIQPTGTYFFIIKGKVIQIITS